RRPESFRFAAAPGRPDLKTRRLKKQVRTERGESRRSSASDGGSTPPASTILLCTRLPRRAKTQRFRPLRRGPPLPSIRPSVRENTDTTRTPGRCGLSRNTRKTTLGGGLIGPVLASLKGASAAGAR